MKVTKQSNKLILILIAINLVLRIVTAVLRVQQVTLFNSADNTLYYTFRTASELTYLIPLYYLACLLRFVHEKKAIQVAVFVLLGVDVLNFIAAFVPVYTHTGLTISLAIGALIYVAMIFLVVTLFQVNNPILSGAFKIYAWALILVMIADISASLLVPLMFSGINEYKYLGFPAILPVLAILYIVYRADGLFEHNIAQPGK